jgi:hypothetical protein
MSAMTDAPCTYPDCTHRVYAAELCRGHYSQRQRGHELAPLREHGRGYRALTLRLRDETIDALGPDARTRARQILEGATET